MRHPDQLRTRPQILSRVWHHELDPGTSAVDVYLGYLRRKLNQPGLPRPIHTVRAAGYRLREPSRPASRPAPCALRPGLRPGPDRAGGGADERSLMSGTSWP